MRGLSSVVVIKNFKNEMLVTYQSKTQGNKMKNTLKLSIATLLILCLTACEAKTEEEKVQDKAVQKCLDTSNKLDFFNNDADKIEFCEKEIKQKNHRGVGIL